jgi:hypothetical protein
VAHATAQRLTVSFLGARERLFSRVVRHLRGALLLAVGLAACNEPRPPVPKLWTLFDVQDRYAGGAQPTNAIATDAGLPGGVPLGTILEADGTTLFVKPTWAEGYAGAYVTTEVWTHFDRVWAQPMYVPIRGWAGADPTEVVDGKGAWHPIFSVGPDSLFYSPFWQIIYVLVPDSINDGDLTSVRQILDGGYTLYPSIGWVAALSPSDVSLDAMPSMPSGGALPGQGWLDGAPISFIKFPAAPFWFDDQLVVEEIPIFHFVFVKADGSLVAPAIPSVLGTGPLYSNRAAPLVDELPTAKYSAYWRVYTVRVPLTARVFALEGSQLALDLTGDDVPVGMNYGPDIANPVDAAAEAARADLVGRVALKPDCFSSLANAHPHFSTACGYLDSQADIEAQLPPAAIERTDITITCPLVSVNGGAVGP